VPSILLAPLQTTDAHAYWQVFLDGRSDLPSRSLALHVERYLNLPSEEQRTHFAVREGGRVIGTLRLTKGTISGFAMAPDRHDRATAALVKAIDVLRAQGASGIEATFEDRYDPAFVALGFKRWYSRVRMEAPTSRFPRSEGIDLRPPEEPEVLGLTEFFMGVYQGHIEQQFGMHVGPLEEWRGYILGTLKGSEAGRFMPDASFVILDDRRILGAILATHWMGMPLVSELGVAKDRQGKGLGQSLLKATMTRLAELDEPRLALYTTVGNAPAFALYAKTGFVQVGGQTVTAKREA